MIAVAAPIDGATVEFGFALLATVIFTCALALWLASDYKASRTRKSKPESKT